jgi:hypothetical protein
MEDFLYLILANIATIIIVTVLTLNIVVCFCGVWKAIRTRITGTQVAVAPSPVQPVVVMVFEEDNNDDDVRPSV